MRRRRIFELVFRNGFQKPSNKKKTPRAYSFPCTYEREIQKDTKVNRKVVRKVDREVARKVRKVARKVRKGKSEKSKKGDRVGLETKA